MIGKNKKESKASTAKNGAAANKDQITTLVGEGASFEGNITTSSARIDGTFKGEAKLYGNLIVGEKGYIHGEVSSPKIMVFGKIEGKVKANLLEIMETGNIEGDISVQTLTVANGGIFNGNSSMKQTEQPRVSSPESGTEVTSFQEFKASK